MNEKTPGQLIYEAYAESRGWQTYAGNPMPSWDEQDDG